MTTATIQVYLDNGCVYEYTVKADTPSDCAAKAREHAAEIVRGGYRHNDGKTFEHYPPHCIRKVKVTGITVPTLYPDKVRGT